MDPKEDTELKKMAETELRDLETKVRSQSSLSVMIAFKGPGSSKKASWRSPA